MIFCAWLDIFDASFDNVSRLTEINRCASVLIRHHDKSLLVAWVTCHTNKQISLQWRHLSVMASQITYNSIVCSTGWQQRNRQSPTLLTFSDRNPLVAGIFPLQNPSYTESLSMSWSPHERSTVAMHFHLTVISVGFNYNSSKKIIVTNIGFMVCIHGQLNCNVNHLEVLIVACLITAISGNWLANARRLYPGCQRALYQIGY